MGIQLRNTPALRLVVWRDLCKVSVVQMFRGLLRAPPWLIVSLVLARTGWLVPALFASAIFFMAGLRQAHDSFHLTLGLPRRATDVSLFFLSVAMGVPLHAVKFNHLRHHAHPLEADDVEGSCARLPGWAAIICGPYFTIHGQVRAFSKVRGIPLAWMVAEAATLAIAWVITLRSHYYLLRYHMIVMALGNCLTGFFAVWLVHHDCDDHEVYARTQRGRLLNAVTFNLFYHLEHHLFPAVPACHLPELARRIDAVYPPATRFPVVGPTPTEKATTLQPAGR